MEIFQNKKKRFWLLIVILLIVCLVQGGFIYNYAQQKSNENIFDDPERLSTFLDELFQKEKKDQELFYDRIFNDDFFSKQKDPFEEMEQMHQRMEEMMSDHFRLKFNHSWNDWFSGRFQNSNEFGIKTKTTAKSYIVTISIPNLKENNLNIKIEKDTISVEGQFSQNFEKKDDKGNITGKQEVYQSLSKMISIPTGLDSDNAKIDKKKDRIIITIPKIKS